MPYLKSYNLFISHGWYYNYDYERLIHLLNNAPNFKWKNYSVSYLQLIEIDVFN